MIEHAVVRSDDLRTRELQIDGMRLHAMDAWVRRASVLTDAEELKAILLHSFPTRRSSDLKSVV